MPQCGQSSAVGRYRAVTGGFDRPLPMLGAICLYGHSKARSWPDTLRMSVKVTGLVPKTCKRTLAGQMDIPHDERNHEITVLCSPRTTFGRSL